MKKTFLTLLLSICCFSVFSQDKKFDTLVVKTNIYCDHCQECESCGGRIESTLFDVVGIKKVTIDPATNTISVVYKPKKTSPDEIRQAINKAGYDADESKASRKDADRLDACCKKKE